MTNGIDAGESTPKSADAQEPSEPWTPLPLEAVIIGHLITGFLAAIPIAITLWFIVLLMNITTVGFGLFVITIGITTTVSEIASALIFRLFSLRLRTDSPETMTALISQWVVKLILAYGCALLITHSHAFALATLIVYTIATVSLDLWQKSGEKLSDAEMRAKSKEFWKMTARIFIEDGREEREQAFANLRRSCDMRRQQRHKHRP